MGDTLLLDSNVSSTSERITRKRDIISKEKIKKKFLYLL